MSLTLPLGVGAVAVPVALRIDRWLGEPTARLHPVVWMGRYLRWAGRHVQGVAGSARQPAQNEG